MKLINKKIETREYYTIDYQNGILCNVGLVNGKLDNYNFRYLKNKNLRTLCYVPNIEPFINTSWANHYDLLKEHEVIFSNDIDLQNFTEFDDLYCFNGSVDGILYDYKAKPVSNLISVNYSDASIYCKIKGYEKSKKFIEMCNKSDVVKKATMIEVPYYNQDTSGLYSVEFEVLLPQKLYNLYIMSGGDRLQWLCDFIQYQSKS